MRRGSGRAGAGAFARAAVAALALGAGTAIAAPAEDPAYGYWLTANGRAIVALAPCGAEACGRIVWTAGQGAHCGRAMLGALRPAGPGRWGGGFVEDPRDGRRYDAELSAEGDRLTLRGYLGLRLFGRSQVWTRVADDRGGCSRQGL